MIRDDRKPVLLGRHAIGKPKISVYSSAGGLLQTIQVRLVLWFCLFEPERVSLTLTPRQQPRLQQQWDAPTRIVALGWTLTEALVVLTQDGTYRLYTLSTGATPPAYTQHSLGAEAQEAGVLEAKIYEEGMVVLLGSLSFVEVKGWQRTVETGGTGGKVTPLASAGLNEPPSCWCVIPPELSQTRGVEVLIGSGATVLRLDEIEVQDQVRPLCLFAASMRLEQLTP